MTRWAFYESGKQAHRTGRALSDNPYRDDWSRSEWTRGFNEEGDRVRWASHSKCFACNRPLKATRHLVRCQDEQTVFVGPECFRKIKADGWQPPLGGPRLYKID